MHLFLILSFVLGSAWAQESEENTSGFLLYEDQKTPDSFYNDGLNFLTLKKKMHEEFKIFKDITICFRFNLLSYMEGGESYPMFIQTNKHVEVLSKRLGTKKNMTDSIRISFSLTDSSWMWMYAFPEHIDEVIEQNGVYAIWPIYKEEVNANEWHSMCYGFDVKKNVMYLVHNGKTQDNVSQPQLLSDVNRGFDTSMVEPFTAQSSPWDRTTQLNYHGTNWHGNTLAWNTNPFSGYFTDYQIFGHSLSAQEMFDITSCKSFPTGDVYAWDPEDWEPYDKELQKNETTAVQYRTVNISRNSLCKTVQKYTFFPDGEDFEGSINLCRRFGGRLVDTSTSEKRNGVVTLMKQEVGNNNKWLSTYTWYTDAKEFNVWIHYETGELPKEPMVWSRGEPNGGMVENCANLLYATDPEDETKLLAIYNDLTCKVKIPVVCEAIGDVVIKFRGICKYSLIDTTYRMVEGQLNFKRYFAGNTGWKIFWESESQLWRLDSPKQENMFGIHTEFATYPLGKNYWKIVNDSRCTYPNPEKMMINMSPCNSSSFTCDDGTCIPMTGRCDQNTDCTDITDEKGCKIVVIDPNNYMKDKPPKQAEVRLGVELLQILEIGELAMLYRTKYTIYLEWLDPRITFYNLHGNQGLNTLVEEEKQMIWTPRLIFENTDESTRTTTDSESVISVKRQGNFTQNTIESIDNIYMFEGMENPLDMNRVYETEWICDYQMHWYPFDTQTCRMTFAVTKDMNNFIRIIGNGHTYTGPVELTQYFVRGTEMFEERLRGEQQAIVMEVTLGRRLLGTLLTIYLPTVLLNVIGHATNYFKPFFFEAVVSVNLTVKLVLTTMFINVSNQLPKTSYVKMIDIWLIFSLILPFTEVLLHTYKDWLRDEKREVNQHGRVRTLGDDDETDTDNVEEIGDKVLQNNWVGDTQQQQLNLDLISRHEDVQVNALKDYYSNLTPNEKMLKRADFVGFTVIPTFASIFVAGYWTIGLMKNHSPDWSAYTFLVPDFQEDSSYEEMMDVAVNHIKSFFDANSTLVKSLEEAGTNLTRFVSEAMQNSSVLRTWNQTLQESINSL